jgi:hypothetical protein
LHMRPTSVVRVLLRQSKQCQCRKHHTLSAPSFAAWNENTRQTDNKHIKMLMALMQCQQASSSQSTKVVTIGVVVWTQMSMDQLYTPNRHKQALSPSWNAHICVSAFVVLQFSKHVSNMVPQTVQPRASSTPCSVKNLIQAYWFPLLILGGAEGRAKTCMIEYGTKPIHDACNMCFQCG